MTNYIGYFVSNSKQNQIFNSPFINLNKSKKQSIIKKRYIDSGGNSHELKRPLFYDIIYNNGYYETEIEELEIEVYEKSVEALNKSIDEEICFLLKNYVMEDDSKLDFNAVEYKRKLSRYLDA